MVVYFWVEYFFSNYFWVEYDNEKEPLSAFSLYIQ